MKPEQERHLQSLIAQHAAAFEAKYRKGQAEHGGTLSEASCAQLLDHALEEVLDLWAYLQTLKQKQVGKCGCHVRGSKTVLCQLPGCANLTSAEATYCEVHRPPRLTDFDCAD